MSPVVLYREDQRFSVLLIGGMMLSTMVVGLILMAIPEMNLVGIILFATGAATLALFGILKLVTEVRDDGLYVRLFPFPFRRFAFDDIESYYVRTYRPIREYGGWGLRYGFSGKAYNARGNRGLQLVLRSGSRVLIGSQQPEELEAALADAAASAGFPLPQVGE